MHYFCEDCETHICDKCDQEEHNPHKKHSFLYSKDYTYLANMIKINADKLGHKSVELINFDERIEKVEEVTTRYFEDEYLNIDSQINNLINLLTQNLEKIRCLYEKLQKQFKENFKVIKIRNAQYEKDLHTCMKLLTKKIRF